MDPNAAAVLLQNTQAQVMARWSKYARSKVEQLIKDNGEGNVAFKNEIYFSKIRFEPTIAVDGSLNATYTFKQGQTATAFSYGIGGDMKAAGYGATGTGFTTGTLADTNLINATGRETNGGDMMVIEAIAFRPTPKSDPLLLNDLVTDLSIAAGFNGQFSDYKLGNPLGWPGAGGLSGAARTLNIIPAQAEASGIYWGAVSNGLPGAGDARWLTDQIVWMPRSAGGDGVFQIQAKVERDVVVVASARAAGTGIVAVTPNGTAGTKGTFVEFEVLLFGSQVGPRSRNR
jgi:hypothetical protein